MAERDLAGRFRHFAQVECVPDSPLYSALAQGIADTPALLELAGQLPDDQPPALLFLASVQALLLSGVGHRLGQWYPSIDRAAPQAWTAADGDPVPDLIDFCNIFRVELLEHFATRRVQTNECARIALFLPALIGINARMGEPLATIELGASAGLNLLWPFVEVDYGELGTCRPRNPGLSLKCQVRAGDPPMSSVPPAAGLRLGLDSHPVQLSDPLARRWLDALVWPENRDRRVRLRHALDMGVRRMVTVERGDIIDDLAMVADRVGPGDHLVLLHNVVLYQLSVQRREQFEDALVELSHRTPFHRVGLEWIGTPTMELSASFHSRGTVKHSTLARVHPHGEWIEWLDAEIPL